MKKYSSMLSAAVVTGALRVKLDLDCWDSFGRQNLSQLEFHMTEISYLEWNNFSYFSIVSHLIRLYTFTNLPFFYLVL